MCRVMPNASLNINRRYFCRTTENLISSIITEDTRVVFFFFYEKILHAQKAQKRT